MRHSIYSILKSNQVIFQRAWHILAIVLVLVSNFGTLAVPASAKAPEQVDPVESSHQADTTNYIPPHFVHPVPRIATQSSERPNRQTVDKVKSTGRTPIMFIENIGQFDQKALFQTQGGQGPAIFASDALWFSIQKPLDSEAAESAVGNPPGQAIVPTPVPDTDNQNAKNNKKTERTNLRFAFVGSNPNLSVKGFNPLETKVSYFIGNDPENWHPDVPVWGGVRYQDIFPGYDLEVTGEDAQWDWQLVQSGTAANAPVPGQLPQAKTKNLRLHIDGAKSIHVEKDRIRVETDLGNLDLPLPKVVKANRSTQVAPQTAEGAWLDGNEIVLPYFVDGSGESLPASPQSSQNNSRFSDVNYRATTFSNQLDGNLSSIDNDQDLLYSTYLGGNANSPIQNIAVDSSGNAYLIGPALATEFPASYGATTTYAGAGNDLAIYKLSPDGSQLLYLTLIGGSSDDCYEDCVVGVDGLGQAYVLGNTYSTNFPLTASAYDRSPSYVESYLVKLNQAGSALLYSSYLGGSSYDFGHGIAVVSPSEVYVTGMTDATDFPTTANAYSRTKHGSQDIYLSKFDTTASGSLSLPYSTYIGGDELDQGHGIAVFNGDVYVTGQTSSSNFPTINAYDSIANGGWDSFVFRFQPGSNRFVFSTYLGGSGYDCETNYDFRECAIALDASGAAYVSGVTASPDFPLENSHNASPTNGDTYLAKFAPNGQMVFSTHFGGASYEAPFGIGVDGNSAVYVAGRTSSSDFPVTAQAFDPTTSTDEAFLVKFTSDGHGPVYSTFLGGSSGDMAFGLALGPGDVVYVAGGTGSSDFPLSSAPYDSTLDGGSDGFVVALDVSKYRTVSDPATWNACNDPMECPFNAQAGSGGFIAGPINTRTGGLFYKTQDLSISTAGGELAFRRTYSSLSTDSYTTTLGYGWTSNLETHLIFPEMPGGEPGYVLFKAHSANQYNFLINDDGSYSAEPGVVGKLTKQTGAFTTYTLQLPTQTTYLFDAAGNLTTWTDSKGNHWNYTYNAQGLLQQVGTDAGSRYLSFAYDPAGHLIRVMDHVGRSIEFTYDSAGNLVTATNLVSGAWQYRYDSSHHLTEVIDPGNKTVERTEYDSKGRAVRQWDGEGNLTAEIGYNSNGTTTIWNAEGYVQTHSYDGRGTLTSAMDARGAADSKEYDNNFRPTALTDTDGNSTQLAWSADGSNLTQIVDAAGKTTSLGYDEQHNLTSIIDPLNHLTTYTYEGANLKSTTDALNKTSTYTYTPEGFLASVTDPLGHTTSYTYDSHGQRISMTDALQNTWLYAYDLEGKLTDTTDPAGHVTHNEYDAAGQLVKVTRNYAANRPKNDASQWNIVTEYTYDAVGNQIAVTDTLGHITTYSYDANNRLLQTIDPANNVTSNTYDSMGRLLTTTDPLQRVTTYNYDETGRLASTVNPLGGMTSSLYNLDGNLAGTIDPLGRITSFTYDSLNRLITTTDPLGNTTTNSYDDAGNLVSTSDAKGHTTTYDFDALGRRIRQTDQAGGITEYFYDDAGNLIQQIDPRHKVTTFEYDALNRQVRQIDSLGGITQSFYDTVGNKVKTIDARGKETFYEYDALNRMTAQIDALGNRTTFSYDALGRRLSMTDANGNTTTSSYDVLGRTVEVMDPQGNKVISTYDAVGNLVSHLDPLNRETKYQYDILNRLLAQTDPLNGITTYTYDAAGNRLTVKDANDHTTTTVYDVLNRAVSVIDANGNAITNTYDEIGNLIGSTDVLGNRTSFAYDELNRQVSVEDALGNATVYTYDAAGNRTSSTDANGIVTAYQYDDLSRLIAVVENQRADLPADSQTNVRTEYTYDQNGNRLTIRDGNGHTTIFTYDDLNRLLSESDPLNHTWQYSYDAAGNRIQMIDANGQTIRYEYDFANRLILIDFPAPNADITYQYDAAGQRTSMSDSLGQTSWQYDTLGRPLTITDPFAATVHYAYDAVGDRTSITYPGGKMAVYSYDPANLLKQVTDWNNKITAYTYDPANRLVNAALPNGVMTNYSYDPANRLASITHQTSAQVLASYAYTLDKMGNRIQVVERLATVIPAVTSTATAVATSASTAMATSSATLTPEPSASPTPTARATETALPSETITATPSAPGDTPTVTATETPAQIGSFDYTGQLYLVNFAAAKPVTATPTTSATPGPSRTPTVTPIFTNTAAPTKSPTPRKSPTSTRTLTATSTVTNTPTLTNTPDPYLTNSGFHAPIVYSAAPFGDGNGFEINPAYALADDGLFAVDQNSGTSSSNICDTFAFANHDGETYSKFGFSVPAGQPIHGIEVRLDAKVDNAADDALMCVSIIGGEQGGEQKATSFLTTAEKTYLLGSSNDNWGLSLTGNDMNQDSFRVQVINMATSRQRTFSLDYVAVKVYYSDPTPTPTFTATYTATTTGTATWTPQATRTPLTGPTSLPPATATPARNPTAIPTDLPTPQPVYDETTINYAYDPLNRLIAADYSTGNTYHYSYDAVGNRLSQESTVSGLPSTVQYQYDTANHLMQVGGTAYTFDANGNQLSNGMTSYTYDAANHLVTASNSLGMLNYAYNGLGDRLQETLDPLSDAAGQTTTFTMDLNSGLSQVLSESAPQGYGTYDYLYGNGRIAQVSATSTEYFLGDALGSVRQLTDATGAVTMAQLYDPYGMTVQTSGSAATNYGFTGEYTEPGGQLYLRSRYYSADTGRFLSRDTWDGDENQPISYNKWAYAYANPVLYTDPTGRNPIVAALLPGLVGGAAGFAIGATFGGIFGAAIYPAALAGECGCDTQQQALSMTRWQFAGAYALSGGVMGGIGGAIAAYGPIGLIVVGGAGVVISGADLISSYNIIKNETGLTPCMAARVLMDVAGIVFGGMGIAKGVRAWRASGSGLRWMQPPVVGGSGIRLFGIEDLSAVEEFASYAQTVNEARGLRSFGGSWILMAKSPTTLGRLFIYQVGDRITGMMLISPKTSFYEIVMLEGTGGGSGTTLFKYAIQDSISRGYGGGIFLKPASQANSWYLNNFPGSIEQNGGLYWSPDAALKILQSR